MKWQLCIGAVAGILTDRFSVHKVLEQKNEELESAKEKFFVLGEWLTMLEQGKTAADVLRDKGISVIAIYGMGVLGSHLYQQVKNSGICVSYIIDQKPLKGIYDAKVCGIEEKLIGVEAVVVTPVYQFEKIRETILEYNDVVVISLRDLLEQGERREKDDQHYRPHI